MENYVLQQRIAREQRIMESFNCLELGSSKKLEKAYIPQNIVGEFMKDFNDITNKLYVVQTLLEHCHRETKSSPRHEALGDAYQSFSYQKDQIIEFIIGDSGYNYGVIESSNLPEFTPDLAEQAAGFVCELAREIEGFAEQYDIPCVENAAQDLHGVGAKLKYKLQLDNPLEGNFNEIEKAKTGGIARGTKGEIRKKSSDLPSETKDFTGALLLQKGESKAAATERAEEGGFPKSAVTEGHKKGEYYIAPHGVESERGKKTYAALRSEGRSKEDAAKISHYVDDKVKKGAEIIELAIVENFQKGIIPLDIFEGAVDVIIKAGNHRYLRREGGPGNYKYIYKEGEVKNGSNKEEGFGKKYKLPVDIADELVKLTSERVSEELVGKLEALKKEASRMWSSLDDEMAPYGLRPPRSLAETEEAAKKVLLRIRNEIVSVKDLLAKKK